MTTIARGGGSPGSSSLPGGPPRSRSLASKALARAMRRCERCGEKEDPLEADHIVPLALGGKDAMENLQCLCSHCHMLKTRRDVSAIAKAKRIKRKHEAPYDPPETGLKRKVGGRVVRRET